MAFLLPEIPRRKHIGNKRKGIQAQFCRLSRSCDVVGTSPRSRGERLLVLQHAGQNERHGVDIAIRLEHILPDYTLSPVPLSMLIAPERTNLTRVRLCVDFLAEGLRQVPGISR